MPRKLTIIGVLVALVVGIVGLAQGAGAALLPNQSFCSGASGPPGAGPCPTGASPIDWQVCYDKGGSTGPAAPGFTCDALSSATNIAAVGNGVTPIKNWQLITVPWGSRLTLPVTYTPTTWGSAAGVATGATTGNVTALTEVLCNGAIDVLADAQGGVPLGTTDNTTTGWPGNGWGTFDFKRGTVAGGLVTGGPAGALGPSYAYIDAVKPMPFPDVSVDVARLLTLWLGGTLPYPIPPNASSVPPVADPNFQGAALVALNTLSTYAPVQAQVAILGGDPNPPSAGPICLDSPQNSVAENDELLAPTVIGDYYRWTGFQSAEDLINGQVTRVLITRCVHVGSPGACAAMAAPGDTDLVPNEVEAILGSSPTSNDTDADGSSDYDEIFQFTNPTVADTDGDGSLDKQDDLAGFDCISVGGVCTVANLGDTTADDNCPVDPNAAQENSDSQPDFTNTPNTPAGAIYRGDATNPHQDRQGDACDNDKDNDGLNNVVEPAFLHPDVSPGAGGGPLAGSLYCLPSGAAAPVGGGSTVSTDPLNPDSDSDGGLDGRECQFGSDPTSAAAGSCQPTCNGNNRYPISCTPSIAVNCEGAVGNDAESTNNGDALYPDTMETYYRTQHINVACSAVGVPVAACTGAGPPPPSTVNQSLDDLEQPYSYCTPAGTCGSGVTAAPDGLVGNLDPDSDGDFLNDGVEVKWYLTAPSNFDTDRDGCSDGREVADINGDHKVNAIDLGQVFAAGSGNTKVGGITKPYPWGTASGVPAATTLSVAMTTAARSVPSGAESTSIVVTGSTAGWMVPGDVTIGTETIRYNYVTGSTLSGLVRGAYGTVAAAHAATSAVTPVVKAYMVSGTRRDETAIYDLNKDGLIGTVDLLLTAKLTGNCAAGIGAQTAQPILSASKP